VSPDQLHEAVVLTVSTRAAAGDRHDTAGPMVVGKLQAAGWDVAPEPIVLADDEGTLARLMAGLADAGQRLIVTTGGTGLSPSDRTPEATVAVADRQVPGFGEEMRRVGVATTPLAALSRGVAATRGLTLIVNLPGSPAGAAESLDAVLPLLRHAVDQLSGVDHHPAAGGDG
jgi:molybdenum cofactor synthesis domain-containing protein